MEAANLLGRVVGEVIWVDVDERPTRNIRYLRVRVWVNPEQPLVSGFHLKCPDGSRRLIVCSMNEFVSFVVHVGGSDKPFLNVICWRWRPWLWWIVIYVTWEILNAAILED